jgi:predicted ribosome quality control (RQC) complex YloA/Tae2 family protein
MVCLQAGMTRMHLMDPPARNKAGQPRFAEFLRSRIKGGRVSGIRQLGGERIVVIGIQAKEGLVELFIRLWGNAANIIAVNAAGMVLDAFYRRPLKGETSGEPWRLPEIHEPGEAGRQRFPVRAWAPAADGEECPFNRWLSDHYAEIAKRQDFQVHQVRLERLAMGVRVRLEGRLATLLRQTAQNTNPERYRQLGEMLMAFKAQIHRGAAWFETEDWYNPGTGLRIELDPKVDAVANAERYFQRFQKARDGQKYLEEDLAQVRSGLARLENIEADIKGAADRSALDKAGQRLEIYQEGSVSRKPGQSGERPGLAFHSHNFPVFVGRTAAENDELLRRHVRGNDYWLHVRDLPGGYVFIKVPKTKSVPLETLLDAAHLAVWYSKAKHEPEADLFYTQVKYLRRAKHGTYGMVIPTRERNLHVQMDADRLGHLLGNLNPES